MPARKTSLTRWNAYHARIATPAAIRKWQIAGHRSSRLFPFYHSPAHKIAANKIPTGIRKTVIAHKISTGRIIANPLKSILGHFGIHPRFGRFHSIKFLRFDNHEIIHNPRANGFAKRAFKIRECEHLLFPCDPMNTF